MKKQNIFYIYSLILFPYFTKIAVISLTFHRYRYQNKTITPFIHAFSSKFCFKLLTVLNVQYGIRFHARLQGNNLTHLVIVVQRKPGSVPASSSRRGRRPIDLGWTARCLDKFHKTIEGFWENRFLLKWSQISCTSLLPEKYQLPPSQEIHKNCPPCLDFEQYIECIDDTEKLVI